VVQACDVGGVVRELAQIRVAPEARPRQANHLDPIELLACLEVAAAAVRVARRDHRDVMPLCHERAREIVQVTPGGRDVRRIELIEENDAHRQSWAIGRASVLHVAAKV